MLKLSRVLITASFILLGLHPAYAAKMENLAHQPLSALRALSQPMAVAAGARPQMSMQERSRKLDDKQNLHIRMQETYAGYSVWGADAVIHLPHTNKALMAQSWNVLINAAPNASMNGLIYRELDKDLQNAPAYVFEDAQAQQALSRALSNFQDKAGHGGNISDKQTRLMVYVDKEQKAHWAYFIHFLQEPLKGAPHKPSYIMDAQSFEVYRNWDDIQYATLSNTNMGGYGGNPKLGKLIYDGLKGDLPALPIDRDDAKNTCYLENTDVAVKDVRKNEDIEKFFCKAPDTQHNSVYWHGSLDSINGAYSPALDALYVGKIIKDMYQEWYGLPVLVKNGKPMLLVMRVHWDHENAYWNGKVMTFGDGGNNFYPLVSLGIGAHEVSHGFTEQNSGLIYDHQSGGLNESFSDMAAQAAEFYAYGTSSWLLGAEIVKDPKGTLRNLEHPSLDCAWLDPDNCSIEHVKDYRDDLDVHYTSGVFNRVFFLLAHAPDWSTRKAFDVMVRANRFYWTPEVSYVQAACGVKSAAKDLGYAQEALVNVFKDVGININKC